MHFGHITRCLLQFFFFWGCVRCATSHKQVSSRKLIPVPPEFGHLFLYCSEPFVMVAGAVKGFNVSTLRCFANQESIWCNILNAVFLGLYPSINWVLIWGWLPIYTELSGILCNWELEYLPRLWSALFTVCTVASTAPFLYRELARWIFHNHSVPFSAAVSSRTTLFLLSKKLYRSSKTGFTPMKLVPESDQCWMPSDCCKSLISHWETFGWKWVC